MKVMVPMDVSDASRRALEYAVDLVGARGGSVHVIHFTDAHDEATEEFVDDVEATIDDAGVEGDVEVVSDVRLSQPRASSHVGRRILKLADERGFDHVVMGHHETGVVGELVLGSTAKTVVDAGDVLTTVVPSQTGGRRSAR